MWAAIAMGVLTGFLVGMVAGSRFERAMQQVAIPAWEPPVEAWGKLRSHADVGLQRGVIDLEQAE